MAIIPFDGRKPEHSVLKLTLRSGEKYAVDLAGAQHGHFEPVTPWDEFEEERILNIVSTKVIFLSHFTAKLNSLTLNTGKNIHRLTTSQRLQSSRTDTLPLLHVCNNLR